MIVLLPLLLMMKVSFKLANLQVRKGGLLPLSLNTFQDEMCNRLF